jgi:cold shock CspA family protein
VTGKIKFWLDEKGHGFIVGDDGTDYFLWHSDILDEMSVRHWIWRGDPCEFEIGEPRKGGKTPLALNVRVQPPTTRTWRAAGS